MMQQCETVLEWWRKKKHRSSVTWVRTGDRRHSVVLDREPWDGSRSSVAKNIRSWSSSRQSSTSTKRERAEKKPLGQVTDIWVPGVADVVVMQVPSSTTLARPRHTGITCVASLSHQRMSTSTGEDTRARKAPNAHRRHGRTSTRRFEYDPRANSGSI